MDTLADLITSAADMAGPTIAGRPCRLGRILDSATPADREAVITALHTQRGDDGYLADELLAAALSRGGHPVSNATLSRHRRALCGCHTSTPRSVTP